MSAKVAPEGGNDMLRRKLACFTTPSGRVLEYAFDGRCGDDDPWLFHFHALWFNGVGPMMGKPWETYKIYRKPAFKEGKEPGWESLPWKIVSINRAGYGKSTLGNVKPADWTYKHFTDDVAALADMLKAKHFAVFGGSSGGPHVVAAAALLPDRVSAALSLSGDASYCPETMPKGKKINEKLEEGAPITYIDGTAKCRPGACCGERGCCCGCCCWCCCPGGTKADLRVELKKLPYEYSAIKCPVFFIQGEKDDTTDPNCARFLESKIPTAKLTMLPDFGHVQLSSDVFDKVMSDLHAAAKLPPGTSIAPAQEAMP